MLVLALVALGAVFAAPGAANALEYVPPQLQAPDEVVVGSTFELVGEGFQPNSVVTVDIEYGNGNNNQGAALRSNQSGTTVLAGLHVPRQPTFTVTTDAQGTFETPVTLTQVGIAQITATGIDTHGNPVTVERTVRVVAPGSDHEPGGPGAGRLPVTGMSAGNLAMQVSVGVGAVLVGAVAIWLTMLTRRRSTRRV